MQLHKYLEKNSTVFHRAAARIISPEDDLGTRMLAETDRKAAAVLQAATVSELTTRTDAELRAAIKGARATLRNLSKVCAGDTLPAEPAASLAVILPLLNALIAAGAGLEANCRPAARSE
jgi:hypothetical protein